MRFWFRLLPVLIVILLAGFALRACHLGAQAIWGDEAFSIAVGKMALSQIVQGDRDVHPPLFHVLLHLWMGVAGSTEFAARFPALIAGVLLIPAMAIVARRTAGKQAAVLAAGLVAASPFAVYYSQEARMYSQAVLFTTLSAYGFLRLCGQSDTLKKPDLALVGRWQAVMMVATLGAMYSHFYVFFVMLAENVYALWRWRRKPQWLAWWIGTQAVLVIGYLPWVIAQSGFLSGRAYNRWDALGPSGMADVWLKTLIAFGSGTTIAANVGWVALGLMIVVGAGIVAALWGRGPRHGVRAFLPVYLFIPMLAAWGLGPLMPHYYERYLLVVLPAYLGLLALGLTVLARSQAWPAALAVLIVIGALDGITLDNAYFNPAYAKSGYRDLMEDIRQSFRPGDAIVLLNPEQTALYGYYANPGWPAYVISLEGATSGQNQRNFEQMGGYERLWLVLFGNAHDWDPNNQLQTWLAGHTFQASHTDALDGALELYIVGNVQPAQAVTADFGGMIRLTGFGVSSTHIAPGGTLQVALEWQALAQPDRNYTIFTHIVDAQQHIAGQFDGPPQGGSKPTSGWHPGDRLTDRFAITLAPSTAPGVYYLQVGWYDLGTLARLPVTGVDGRPAGDHLILVEIDVP